MRVLIERNELMRALGHVTSVVERRTTVPILSNVLLKAIGSSLELKATDLEREVVETVAAEVTQTGAVTVPAHMLNDIVRKLPDGCDIEIVREAERERLTIRAGQSRFALQTIAADVFPDFAAGELTHTFEVQAADLNALIRLDAIAEQKRR
jgi:DNA polymerase-3 subunit beta